MQPSTKLYHITHVRNLPQIIGEGSLWSDASLLTRGIKVEIVGMSEIKERRLKELPVKCHSGTLVGEYVPFYFCPRSIMLYILHRGNRHGLTYTEGQRPIVHLQADLETTIDWAEQNGVRWAFSNMNAGSALADFHRRREDLDKVNWDAVQSNDFRDPKMKDGKQAEFLVHESFPWTLVERVEVRSPETLTLVQDCLSGAAHKPLAKLEPGWYF